VGVMATK